MWKYTLSLALTLALVLSSCQRQLTVSKRHYNKGFFVHLAPKPGNPVKPEKATKSAVAERAAVKPVQPAETEPAVAASRNAPVRSIPDAPRVHKTKKHMAQNTIRLEEALDYALRPTKVIHAVRSASKSGLVGEALSLLWILIVALLIIYLVGLLVGDFGNAFHLLAVVIIVLLILWLLRII